jgi:succinate dehydrogenase flavin-adding protein (antitoxin of CptAB toxin-antitoxin module)
VIRKLKVLLLLQGMLDLENPDLFKWLTGQEEPPAELQHNLAFKVDFLIFLQYFKRYQVLQSPYSSISHLDIK